jgi:hypothetical protein
MGFIPTKTSVQARGPEGPQGDIPGATAGSAGVMTADQVRMLETVFQWHQTMQGGGGVVEIIRPAPTAGNAQLDAIRKGFSNVSERVAHLERAVTQQPQPTELMLSPPDLTERMDHADHKIATLAEALDGLAAMVEEALQRVQFVEQHALASVQVETKERAA